MTQIPVIRLTGAPYERGFQHGRRFSRRIETLIQELKEHRASSYDAARRMAVSSLHLLRSTAPEVHSEIAGIADGSGSAIEDLYLHIGFEFFEGSPPSGCSGVAVRTATGAIIGQNWDASPEASSDLVVFVHVSSRGIAERLFIGSVGGLGWVGINHHGLALINNDLLLDTAGEGIPSQVIRRLALDHRTVGMAADAMRSLPHMAGRSYMLGDAAGDVIGLEVSPNAGVNLMSPSDLLLHTNNALLSRTITVQNEEALQSVYPSSRSRFAALQRRTLSGASSVTGLKRILSDRTGAPDSISKSPSPAEATATAFSVIFDCGACEIHVCAGPPSDGEYSSSQLDAWASI